MAITYTVEPCERKEIRDFIEKWHYSHNINGLLSQYCFKLMDGDTMVGAMIYGGLGMANCWKKSSAIPNNVSATQLTRIWEHVFVFCRRDEIKTFKTNKKVKSISHFGQKFYETYYNFIEAKNNDGTCPLNKCTYSSELCMKLLGIYGEAGMTVLDPFSGTGTTGLACKALNMNYIGLELSEKQNEWAKNRINSVEKS